MVSDLTLAQALRLIAVAEIAACIGFFCVTVWKSRNRLMLSTKLFVASYIGYAVSTLLEIEARWAGPMTWRTFAVVAVGAAGLASCIMLLKAMREMNSQ